MRLGDHIFCVSDSIDHVRPRAFFDLKRQGRLAVDAGKAGGVFKCAPDRCQIGKRDDGIAAYFDGHFHDVSDIFDQARDLKNKAACAAFDCACGDQTVVSTNLSDEFVK